MDNMKYLRGGKVFKDPRPGEKDWVACSYMSHLGRFDTQQEAEQAVERNNVKVGNWIKENE